MARREWTLRYECGHQGCREMVHYRYSTRRDLEGSFEVKNYSNGRWRCTRHTRPEEVLGPENRETSATLTVEQKPHGRFFGSSGFLSGPGFKVFAADLPEGTKLVVTAQIVLPE